MRYVQAVCTYLLAFISTIPPYAIYVPDHNYLKENKAMNTVTQELPALLEELGVKLTVREIDHPASAPDWAEQGKTRAYRCTLSFNGKRATVHFYQGLGVKTAPTVSDIVYAIARDYDSSSYTLEEFGDEFGWNSHTVSTYKAVIKSGARFKRLFPDGETRQAIAECEY